MPKRKIRVLDEVNVPGYRAITVAGSTGTHVASLYRGVPYCSCTGFFTIGGVST